MLIDELHRLGLGSILVALSFIAVFVGYSIFFSSIIGHIFSPETSVRGLAIGSIASLIGFSLLFSGGFSMYISARRLSRYIAFNPLGYLLVSLSSLPLLLFYVADILGRDVSLYIFLGILLLALGTLIVALDAGSLESLEVKASLAKNLLLLSGALTFIGIGIIILPIAYLSLAFSLLSLEDHGVKKLEKAIEDELRESRSVHLGLLSSRFRAPMYLVYEAALRVARKNNYNVVENYIMR